VTTLSLSFVTILLSAAPARSADELTVETPAFRAAFADGQLSRLVDAAGNVLVEPGGKPSPITMHYAAGPRTGRATGGRTVIQRGQSAKGAYSQFAELADAGAENSYGVDAAAGDLTLTQHGRSTSPGMWGVSWSIGQIPSQYAIIIPGHSGTRLDQHSPGDRHTFDFPMSWEAQLVIVEGPGRGFYVWSDDTAGRYKRLVVERRAGGWVLTLITMADAPFDRRTECRSAPWRLNVYQGDWRVPARRYRQWMQTHYQAAPLERQRPTWVSQIRACVIMGLEPKILESLVGRFDPPQTLLYLPSWRAAGYDRDYPDYDAVLPEFESFLARARQLGFRVMVHTNYFGVDPLHADYTRFERFQVRSPWGTHERQWWLWERADPVIRFAYINPALRAWREHFVKAMVRLCRRFPIDALHLDQTLCIYNDHNGRIDGMSMLEGNLALHRELRAALPEVALSGEGLNEVTCCQEAFAQRHAWGLNHAEGDWDKARLRCAHPISSFLFLPYTRIYGYLGYAPPATDQLYAAWNEAYEHWGVIPTLKPQARDLEHPSAFTRQLFDEVAFYQKRKVEIDLDRPWPADMAFPLRTADGQPAARTCDGRLLCADRTISWTLRDVNQVASAGTIPGWRAYDERRLLGLDPERWYPVFDEPRDAAAFHVSQVPAGVVVEEVVNRPELAVIRTRPVIRVVADLLAELRRATCGSRVAGAERNEVAGPLQGADGSQFVAGSRVLMAHPAWKATVVDPRTGRTAAKGTGPAYARFTLDLPRAGTIRFRSMICLEKKALGPGRSDGVTFGVVARAAERHLQREVHCASELQQPFELDLTPLAGLQITLELTAGPGPQGHPSFDWARWHEPRVEQQESHEGPIAVTGPGRWSTALAAAGPVTLAPQGAQSVARMPSPGTLVLLRDTPPAAALPADVARLSRVVAIVSDNGRELDRPPVAGITPATVTIGGVQWAGLRAHPPDHGRTIAYLPMRLPPQPAVFRTFIGIAGDKSAGVVFRVEVNGRELVQRRMLPGQWEELTCDLRSWANLPVVLALGTDSDGPFSYDWAHWGQPRIIPAP
jgi:hypothetical protein